MKAVYRVCCSVLILNLAGPVLAGPLKDKNNPYMVPVGERADLEPYNTVEVRNTVFKKLNDGAILLKYKLPEVLVGKTGQNLEFIGVPSEEGENIQLKGQTGSGNCQILESGKYDCHLEYIVKELKVDLVGARKAISKISKSDLEIAKRMEIAEIFSNDPIGIVESLALKK